jgi:hypothetical protein
MDEKNLPPGYWLDDGREALETVQDVEELEQMVHDIMAARIVQKIRTGSYYRGGPDDNLWETS